MKLGFKDWRECSQDLIPLRLDLQDLTYIHAKTWHLKGYLGGTHSWMAVWGKEHKQWLVIEINDKETLEYQGGKIIYDGSKTSDPKERAPFITTRPVTAQWFGNNPKVIGRCHCPPLDAIIKAIDEYPLKDFKLITVNCNTFTSYLIWKLDLDLKRPFRSIGFRNKNWWQANYGT